MDLLDTILASTGTSYSASDLQQFGNNCSGAYLRKEASLTDAVADTVRIHRLNPHQTQRVVEFANHATFQALMTKEAEHKIIEFPVADTKHVLEKVAKAPNTTTIRPLITKLSSYAPVTPPIENLAEALFGKREREKVASVAPSVQSREYLGMKDTLEHYEGEYTASVRDRLEAEDRFKLAVRESVVSGEASPAELLSIVRRLGPVKLAQRSFYELADIGIITSAGRVKTAGLAINTKHPVAETFLNLMSAHRKVAAYEKTVAQIRLDLSKQKEAMCPPVRLTAPARKSTKPKTAAPAWLKGLGHKLKLIESVEKDIPHNDLLRMAKEHLKNTPQQAGLFGAKGPSAQQITDVMNEIKATTPRPAANKLTSLGKAVSLAGLGATGLAGGHAIASAHEKMFEKRGKERSWDQMMRFAPDLKEMDQDHVRGMHNTLWRLSPTAAAEPAVASHWVRKNVEYHGNGIDPASAKQMMDIEKTHNEIKVHKGTIPGALRGLSLSSALLGGVGA